MMLLRGDSNNAESNAYQSTVSLNYKQEADTLLDKYIENLTSDEHSVDYNTLIDELARRQELKASVHIKSERKLTIESQNLTLDKKFSTASY